VYTEQRPDHGHGIRSYQLEKYRLGTKSMVVVSCDHRTRSVPKRDGSKAGLKQPRLEVAALGGNTGIEIMPISYEISCVTTLAGSILFCVSFFFFGAL
jgi:hypothetical protein